MSSSYRITLDDWLRQLDVKADRLLDIGGSQLPLKGRTKSFDVGTYLIADMAEPHIDSPKPDIILDMNEEWSKQVSAQSIFLNKQFDSIFCLEVFDYIFDPVQAFSNIEWLLTIGGTAWVSFPSFYPTHQPIEDDALRYMESGIRKLADKAGLEIVQMIRRRPETNLLQQFFSAERLRAAKHYDHSFIGWIVEFKK